MRPLSAEGFAGILREAGLKFEDDELAQFLKFISTTYLQSNKEEPIKCREFLEGGLGLSRSLAQAACDKFLPMHALLAQTQPRLRQYSGALAILST